MRNIMVKLVRWLCARIGYVAVETVTYHNTERAILAARVVLTDSWNRRFSKPFRPSGKMYGARYDDLRAAIMMDSHDVREALDAHETAADMLTVARVEGVVS